MNETIKMASKDAVDFYPTPEDLAERIIKDIDLQMIKTILEPSAGKGDLLRPLAKRENKDNRLHFEVDCIEFDSNLRQILKYNYSENRERELRYIISQHGDYRCAHLYRYNNEKREWETISEDEAPEAYAAIDEKQYFFEKGIHIVFDDFLSFETSKTYDLIIMNPPFSNGDMHLLKALKMQENGGNIICILNAETIRNPYTLTRKSLINQLEKYNASIEYVKNAFSLAEKKTDVEIAIIKVSIPAKEVDSEIYKRFQKAEDYKEIDNTCEELEVTDYIKAIVARFNVEVKSGVELIRQYKAMIPYMSLSFDEDSYGHNTPILRLTDSNDRGYDSVTINQYLKRVRSKYWRALLSNKKFVGKLTSKLQSEYLNRVESLSAYDFNEFNIRSLSAEMNSQIKKGIENEIIAMFDRLTEEHSWYPETQKNRHYYDGWKTNKAHKIDKKVIIPCYGVFDSYDGRPRTYQAQGLLEDIERILNFLDGGMTREIDLRRTLDICFGIGETKNIGLKYFKATFYKKGTIHLVFTCPELIERFNIYAAQKKNWLPPNYGKATYSNMTTEEKAVVDSFQGEEAYNKILEKSNYYLKPVTSGTVLMLEE